MTEAMDIIRRLNSFRRLPSRSRIRSISAVSPAREKRMKSPIRAVCSAETSRLIRAFRNRPGPQTYSRITLGVLRCSERTFLHLHSKKPGSRYRSISSTLLKVTVKLTMSTSSIHNSEFIIQNEHMEMMCSPDRYRTIIHARFSPDKVTYTERTKMTKCTIYSLFFVFAVQHIDFRKTA